MKPITKKILIGGTIILAIILAFGGGFYYGIDFAYKVYKPKYETELYVRTMLGHSTIKKIDKNQISESHSSLLARLNGDIIAMDTWIPEMKDGDEKKKFQKLLSGIASHRKEFPKYYKEFETNTPQLQEASLMVAEILEKYKK